MTIDHAEVEIPKVTIDDKGNLVIVASPTSSQYDFDFYVGNWSLQNKKLKSRLDNCNEWIEFDATANEA